MERRESLLTRSTGRFGYDTPDQAEKAGMLISKKWIDAAKPLSPGAASAEQMSDFRQPDFSKFSNIGRIDAPSFGTLAKTFYWRQSCYSETIR